MDAGQGNRLGEATLGALPSAIARPIYDRATIRPGIVHLGLGAFHRAHQAVAIDDCLAAGATDWGIVAASLRSPATRDALMPQDGLYTVVERDSAADAFRVIGAILDVLVAPEDPRALITAMADPAIRIISLTVTEKAYLRRADGTLDEDHPDIVHDLAHPDRPRSALGFLAAAIDKRRGAGVAPFTVLSCDNLPANGTTLKSLLIRFAELRSTDLVQFVREAIACPSSMVDRIVPATTDADRGLVEAALGVEDAWPVVTEPFFSWVIEDDFPAGRPDLGTPGVLFVDDVAPHELMKLRLLNGAHSAIAYAGLLLGHETVATAFADSDIRRHVDRLWRESAESLPAAGLDSAGYVERLAARFANTALRHRLSQIGTDGSQKLPQRIVLPLAENLRAGRPVDALAATIALWITALGALARGEVTFTDPLQATLAELAAEPRRDSVAEEILERLGMPAGDLRTEAATRIGMALQRIHEVGPRAAIGTTA